MNAKAYVVVCAYLSLCSLGFGQTWWSNGDVVTHVNVGSNGQDISSFNVDPLAIMFGIQCSFTASGVGPSYLADDYVVGALDERISRFRLRWYQSGVDNPEATTIHLKVFAGDPMAGAALIYSEADPTHLESSTHYVNPDTGHAVYRTAMSSGAAATASARRIQIATVRLGDGLVLSANQQYFFAWSIDSPTGTSAFTSTLPSRGNGRHEQLFGASRSWREARSNASDPTSGSELPFELETTPVPEPATLLAFATGGLALLLRRRKAR